jgi:phosphoglycerol transferase MdoB-like AlkP superfamily enzyme
MVKIPRPIVFLFYTYLSGILIFTLFRLIFIIINAGALREIPVQEIFYALFMGFRFDTVISGYILLLPTLLFLTGELIPRVNKLLARISFFWIYIFYLVAFFICAADLPYFLQFNSRITVAALNWTDTPSMMLKIIFQDIRNYPYLFLFFLAAILFFMALKRIRRSAFKNNSREEQRISTQIIFYAAAILCLFVGIRGRITMKSPIRWGTAFFSQHMFANQAGLNPVFTFGRSWLDSRGPGSAHLNFMDAKKANENTRKFLDIDDKPLLHSPIARYISSQGPSKKYNVILIIMESMGAAKMGAFGNADHLTPHLDSIASRSLFFTNFYSAGIHTFNGVYSTLFGMPSLPGKHTMKDLESQQPFSGIAKILSPENYSTLFFCTHDEQFDNMGGFCTANGFQKIVSQKDYPSDKVLSTLGVPDHVMFDESLSYLDNAHQAGQPFFAAYLTGSDHPPYTLPDDIPFQPRSNNIQQKIVEYADWSVNHFLEQCHKRTWADSTIFIITADHGALMQPVYDADLSMTHTFLIMHAPGIIEPEQIKQMGGQIDIFPTLMGVLDHPYVNNTPGINLLKEQRPYSYFCVDDNVGCIGDEYYLVIRKNGDTSLYRYRDKDTRNYLSEKRALADSMRAYAESNLQTAQDMILHRVVY